MGTPDQDNDDWLAKRFAKIEKENKPAGGKDATQKGSGADNSDIPDSFEKIAIGLKLVPNMDQHSFLQH